MVSCGPFRDHLTVLGVCTFDGSWDGEIRSPQWALGAIPRLPMRGKFRVKKSWCSNRNRGRDIGRYYAAGFKDGGRDHEPRKAGGL